MKAYLTTQTSRLIPVIIRMISSNQMKRMKERRRFLENRGIKLSKDEIEVEIKDSDVPRVAKGLQVYTIDGEIDFADVPIDSIMTES